MGSVSCRGHSERLVTKPKVVFDQTRGDNTPSLAERHNTFNDLGNSNKGCFLVSCLFYVLHFGVVDAGSVLIKKPNTVPGVV